MRIVIVEDDYLQAESIEKSIRSSFQNVELRTITSESEFRSTLAIIQSSPPDLVILDVVLRWQDPQPEMIEQPPDVQSGGIYRAGLRCLRLMKKDPRTSSVPIILYTVLGDLDLAAELEDLDASVAFLRKHETPTRLLLHIRSFIPHAVQLEVSKSTWSKMLSGEDGTNKIRGLFLRAISLMRRWSGVRIAYVLVTAGVGLIAQPLWQAVLQAVFAKYVQLRIPNMTIHGWALVGLGLGIYFVDRYLRWIDQDK